MTSSVAVSAGGRSGREPGGREPANRGFEQGESYRLPSGSVGALRMIGTFPGGACDDLAGLLQSRHRCQRALSALATSDLIGIETHWRGDTKLRIANPLRAAPANSIYRSPRTG